MKQSVKTPIKLEQYKLEKLKDIAKNHTDKDMLKKLEEEITSSIQEIGFEIKSDGIINGLFEAYDYVKSNGGSILTLPQSIIMRSKYSDFNKLIGDSHFDTYSFEVYGFNESDFKICQVQHGCGDLSIPSNFSTALAHQRSDSPLAAYLIRNEEKIDIFNIEDAKNNKPDLNKPFVIQNNKPYKTIPSNTPKEEILAMKKDFNITFNNTWHWCESGVTEEQFRELDDLVLQRYGTQKIVNLEADYIFNKLGRQYVSTRNNFKPGSQGGFWLVHRGFSTADIRYSYEDKENEDKKKDGRLFVIYNYKLIK